MRTVGMGAKKALGGDAALKLKIETLEKENAGLRQQIEALENENADLKKTKGRGTKKPDDE